MTNELERYLDPNALSKMMRLGAAVGAAMLWAALLPAMAGAQTTQPATAASAPTATTAPAQMAFPTYGVSLAAPVGFVRIPEGTPGQMARWVRAKDGQVVTVVSAEAEPAAGRTLAEFAAGMVRTIPGLSTPKPVKLDEFDALEMELRIYSVRLHPVRAVVALKGKYFYLLSAFTSGNEPWEKDFQQVLQSWTWTRIDPASDHLELRDCSMPVFDAFLMTPAALLRPLPAERGSICLGIFDYIKCDHKYILNIERVSDPLRKAPETFLAKFAESYARKINLKQAPQFKKLPTKVDLWLTEAFDTTWGTHAQATGLLGVASLSGLYYLFTVTALPEGAAEKDAFAEMTRKMLESVDRLPPPPAASNPSDK